ncbi:MAG: PD-(D/E)XK nuclease family protein [Thaumarchaeota archaeon]|nr:PD-(D/E)XK nuclease family protein [Nitrososphaerota archaeon]
MNSKEPGGWREALTGFPEFPRAGPVFRHSLEFVKASDIAEQYYCEMKLDLSYLLGRVPSDAKEEGERIHKKVFVMEEVEPKQLVPAIEKLKHVSATFTVYGTVGLLAIVGRPDAITFERGRPRWAIELKTTERNPAKLWTNQLVQVQTYGLLLDQMGFDVSKLDLVLARVQRVWAGRSDLADALLKKTLVLLRSDKYREYEADHPGTVKFYVIPYDRSEAERNILWAQDYWLGKREPVPAHSYGKCRACEYHERCDYSLYPRK